MICPCFCRSPFVPHQVYRFKRGASASAPGLVLEEEVSLPGHRGLPERLFLNAYTRSIASEAELGYGFRLLIAGEDHSLTLLQQVRRMGGGGEGGCKVRLVKARNAFKVPLKC